MRSEKRCKTQKPLIKSYGCAFFWDVLTNEKKRWLCSQFKALCIFSFKKFLFWPGVFKRTGALRVLSHNPGMAFSQSFNIRLWSKEKKYQTPLKEKKVAEHWSSPCQFVLGQIVFRLAWKVIVSFFFLASGKIRFVCYSICRAAALQGFMISSAIDLEASFVERICMTSYPNFF